MTEIAMQGIWIAQLTYLLCECLASNLADTNDRTVLPISPSVLQVRLLPKIDLKMQNSFYPYSDVLYENYILAFEATDGGILEKDSFPSIFKQMMNIAVSVRQKPE